MFGYRAIVGCTVCTVWILCTQGGDAGGWDEQPGGVAPPTMSSAADDESWD